MQSRNPCRADRLFIMDTPLSQALRKYTTSLKPIGLQAFRDARPRSSENTMFHSAKITFW